MNLSLLSEKVFDALQEFDRTSAPLGLYAAGDLAGEEPQKKVQRGRLWEAWGLWKTDRDFPEWNGALRSFFGSEQTIFETVHFYGVLPFEFEEFGQVSLELKRVSKIKVRQYGSKYHVDKSENFDERWGQLGMDKAIAALWSSGNSGVPLRLLLFIGFDKAQRPFERELNELKPHQTRASHGIEFFERTWDDSIGRGFKVKAALWAHQLKKGADPLP